MNIPIIIGFFAALFHVLSGPDHLAAVTPLALERKNKYWKIGTAWGLGHVLGMLLIGLLFYFMKDLIPVEKISGYSEKFVGFMLIAIGIWAIYRIRKPRKLTYPHHHDELTHIHPIDNDRHTHHKIQPSNILLSFGIGIIHGFAGVSHFLLMLPVLGYQSKWQSVQYMLGFAIGIVAAMVIYVSVLEKISKQSANKSKNILEKLQYTGAFAAIIIGIFWIFNA
jgi:cytochrome c biogenesis protein CcdA